MPFKFIVAIGSSAGGLEPLTTFFDATPHDRATYVILTHLPVDHKSQLQKILQRHSRLTIVEAANNIPIEKDTVYMPPASMYMTVKDDRLFLHRRIKYAPQPNRAVDVFLESLAITKGKLSIAIILSGAGFDGTKGVKQIKKAGGMVIAQTIASCQFESMPKHAIATGDVDYELLPEEMPHIVLQHISSRIKTYDLIDSFKQAGEEEL